jgi:hypothetical protein
MFEDESGNTRQFQLYDNIAEFIQTFEEAKEKKKNKGKVEEILDLDLELKEDDLKDE